MTVRAPDQLGLDLFETLTAFGVTPDLKALQIAKNLVDEAEERIWKHGNYFDARRQALEAWGMHENEWEPWEAFLDRFFGRRGGDKAKLANRPFAPIIEDGP